ncbi:hypothetical protein [Sphingobacterium kyonggiense]
MNFGAGRSYIRLDENGQPSENPIRTYTSLTTAINACAPMEKPLLEWYCKLGMDEAARKLEVAQHYGTLMHLEIGKFLMNGSYDFNELETVIEDYLAEHSYYQPECKDWSNKLKNDLAAFFQFYIDYKVKPLGIEYVLLSQRGYGTLIDLVCNMTIQVDGFDESDPYKSGPRKGQPRECKVDREVRAIINFKSGRHGFYRANGLQIESERQLWEENFPDLPLDAGFNWSPKEWTGSVPTYNLKDWTGEITTEEVEAVMMLADIRYASKAERKMYTSIGGVFSMADSDLSLVVRKEGLSEYVTRKFGGSVPQAEESELKLSETRRPALSNTEVSSKTVNEPVSNPLPF